MRFVSYTKRVICLYFRNHFSTIGVNALTKQDSKFHQWKKEDIVSITEQHSATEILEHIRTKMRTYQEETGNLYNLEATPAEGTTYRFAKEDKKRYSDIIQAGEGENIYYTNSSQLPVDYTEDPFEALLLQDNLQCQYTGGTVLHLYMNEKLSSVEACRNFIKK